MSLSLIPDDDHRTTSGQVTCGIGKKLVFGRNEIDKEDKKLSKVSPLLLSALVPLLISHQPLPFSSNIFSPSPLPFYRLLLFPSLDKLFSFVPWFPVFGISNLSISEPSPLLQFVARLEAMDAESARITRIGRTAMHVIPKGETGTLTMCKEGEENGREKSTEVMWLGDQVVMVGSKKHTFVLLPQGKTWFQWAEQHREEQEHRLLELRGIGGQSLTEEELARKDELRIKISRRKEEDEARTEELRKRHLEEPKNRPDTVEGVEDEKGEQNTSKREGILSASDHAGLPPPPPASTSALSG